MQVRGLAWVREYARVSVARAQVSPTQLDRDKDKDKVWVAACSRGREVLWVPEVVAAADLEVVLDHQLNFSQLPR